MKPGFFIIFILNFFFVFGSNRGNESIRDKARFISFDSRDGKIDVDLDLSIPFISIPLDNSPDSNNQPKPLVNVNAKSIAIAGILSAITAFVIPLLLKAPTEHQYRMDESFGAWDALQSINEFILGNNHVTPCVQRAICVAIARANVSKNPPSSVNEIIDGLSKMKWIRKKIKGTAIEEAIEAGRKNAQESCSDLFNKCTIPDQLLQVLLNELGFN